MGSIRSSDEELSLFLEMRRRESGRNNNRFLQKSGEFDPLGSKSGSSPAFNIASAAALRRTCADEFLNADNDKIDYDCLSTADMGKLISSVRVNVTYGKMETRMMMTGMHTVADIFCVCCGSIVGWKYETAHERSQKYKEGKSVLERFKLSGPDGSHYWASHETHVAGSDADDV